MIYALIMLLALAPLGLGGQPLLIANALAIVIALLLISHSLETVKQAAPQPTQPRTMPWILAIGLLLIGWANLQALLPAGPLAAPQWQQLSELKLNPEQRATISLNPERSQQASILIAAYLGLFWLTSQLARTRQNAHTLLKAFSLIALVYALYGLAMHLSGANLILWWQRWAYTDSVTSSFVNRNHYANYAGLGLLTSTALLLEANRKLHGYRWHERLSLLLESHSLMLISAVSCALALLMTHSRGGALATTFGLITLLLLYKNPSRQAYRPLAVILGIGVLLYALVGDGLGLRLVDVGSSANDRIAIWQTSWQAIQLAPWQGYGLGSYADQFAQHRGPELAVDYIWTAAHNDYLQLMLELGIPATILALIGLSLPILATLRASYRRRRDRLYPRLAVAASVLVLSHALVDFALQMPAIALSYAVLLGIGYAQSESSASAPS